MILSVDKWQLMRLSVFWGVVGTIRWTFAVRANGRTVNMTGAEIGIILLVVAYLLHFIVFATYTA